MKMVGQFAVKKVDYNARFFHFVAALLILVKCKKH